MRLLTLVGWEKLPPASRANLSAAALADLAYFPPDWPENELIIAALAFPGVPGANYAFIVGGLVAPLSRGNVTIISADTSVLPVFNPNYLSSPTDQEVAVAIFRRARALLNAPAFSSILIGEEFIPGVAVQTDAEILASLKASVIPAYHASCSCKWNDLVLLRESAV
jgi:choline dehydrogenase